MRLPSLVLALALAAGALGSTGCVARGRATGAFVYTEAPPPPPRRVVVSARAGYIWVEPYWAWSGSQYVWTEGYWVDERPDQFWVQGRWNQHGRRWAWHPGHWRAHGNVHVRGRVNVDRGKRHEVRDHR